jgi:prepilin-type N-terminal cleavage/methylation domain-containing protein
MTHPRSGFTLVEVLVAVVITTLGIGALLGTLTASAALAGDGRRMGLAAVLLASRADELRARVAAAGPGCSAPAAGSAPAAEGIVEAWSASVRGNVVDLVLEARYRRHGRPVADTLLTAVSCP